MTYQQLMDVVNIAMTQLPAAPMSATANDRYSYQHPKFGKVSLTYAGRITFED